MRKTCELLYDGIGFKSDELNKKAKETNLLLHGNENWNNPDKNKETCKERFGYENPMQSTEFNASTKKKYLFEGIYFDSNWEIILYRFLKEHNIKFKYHDENISYTFFYDITRTYIPDFIINGEIVEIKGPHFFQRWKMICPWRYKNDTPDKIEWRNGLFEAKHQCMIKNNVKIITDIFEYIEELKYGL